jgi:hypothetical protein
VRHFASYVAFAFCVLAATARGPGGHAGNVGGADRRAGCTQAAQHSELAASMSMYLNPAELFASSKNDELTVNGTTPQ